MKSALSLAVLMLISAPTLAHTDQDHHNEYNHDHHQAHHHSHEGHGRHGDHGEHGDNLGAHVHGQAHLQLALEGQTLDLFFTSPTVNLLGFEHAPGNDEQQAALEKALNYFRHMPLLHPQGGECQLMEATAATPLTEKEHTGGHADINVTQTLQCSPALSGQPVDVVLLTDWPGIEQLHVEWLGEGGQGSANLDQDNRRLRP